MKLATGKINNKISFFFVNEQNVDNPPIMWISFFKKENKYRILGSMYVLDSFLPKEIRNGNSSFDKCLSYMYDIYRKNGDNNMHIKIPGNKTIHNREKYNQYVATLHLYSIEQTTKLKRKKNK